MRLSSKILTIWLVAILFGALAYTLLTNIGESVIVRILYGMMFLLGIIAAYIFSREPIDKNKFIFLNFSVFFLIGGLQFVHIFIGEKGTILRDVPYANVYSAQYLLLSLYPLAQGFALIYVVVDSLFRNTSTSKKYMATSLIVGGFFLYYYYPVIIDPLYIYKTPDIEDFRTLDKAVLNLNARGIQPSPENLANVVTLPAWDAGKPVGALFEGDEVRRISQILPYLEGDNYLLLIYKPLYLNVVYMSVLCIVFVLLFFGYQYQKDPPQGAYIEKIVFLFLPLASFEALHNYCYVRSIEFETFKHIAALGHFLTFVNLIVLAIFFSLRLSFIRSIKGEFYERELVLDSEHISRWRDGIDNLVIRHFLNPKTIHGRLFAPREAKSRT